MQYQTFWVFYQFPEDDYEYAALVEAEDAATASRNLVENAKITQKDGIHVTRVEPVPHNPDVMQTVCETCGEEMDLR